MFNCGRMDLTLDTLDSLNSNKPHLAVLGFPVRHSLSPAMHNAALQAMAQQGVDVGALSYHALELPVERLAEALEKLHAHGFAGLNLTIPHKVEVLKLLSEVDPEAARMGAVNTLVRKEKGYAGFNTDGYGILKAVEQCLKRSFDGADVLLLGAGGAARAIAVQCLASGCQRLSIVNRSNDRLEQLGQHMRSSGTPLDRVRFATPEELPGDWAGDLLVINATALGLKPDDPAPVDVRRLPAGSSIYDTTYGCRNQLAADCEARGLPYADGLSMLVWQGVRSLEIWTGSEVPVEVMADAAAHALKERQK